MRIAYKQLYDPHKRELASLGPPDPFQLMDSTFQIEYRLVSSPSKHSSRFTEMGCP